MDFGQIFAQVTCPQRQHLGLTAIGNDYGFDEVFARQLQALASPGDVAVAISTSDDAGRRRFR